MKQKSQIGMEKLLFSQNVLQLHGLHLINYPILISTYMVKSGFQSHLGDIEKILTEKKRCDEIRKKGSSFMNCLKESSAKSSKE